MTEEHDSSACGLTLTEAYDIYDKHTQTAFKMWTYFVTLSLALLGYTIGSGQNAWSDSTFLVVGFCYAVAAVGNRALVLKFQKEVERFAELFNTTAAARSLEVKTERGVERVTVAPITHRKASAVHLGITLFVLTIIGVVWLQKGT